MRKVTTSGQSNVIKLRKQKRDSWPRSMLPYKKSLRFTTVTRIQLTWLHISTGFWASVNRRWRRAGASNISLDQIKLKRTRRWHETTHQQRSPAVWGKQSWPSRVNPNDNRVSGVLLNSFPSNDSRDRSRRRAYRKSETFLRNRQTRIVQRQEIGLPGRACNTRSWTRYSTRGCWWQ